RRIFDELLARDFADARYFTVHRLMVDTYCLQHPDAYCASTKSLLAHLTGLGWLIEHGASRAVGSESLRRWVESRASRVRPPLPAVRGRITIADVRDAGTPILYAHAVDRWARATWEAYAPLHAVVRGWIHEALALETRPRK